VFKPRTIFLLIFLVMGLFVAQWQGFSHGVSHSLVAAQHQPSAHTVSAYQTDHAHNDHQSEGKHHCAAYDSQTLSAAMPSLPLSLPAIDKTSAAINSYTTYQASIEAYRPFDVRGPPNS
jgi:hypothetical protein